MQLQTHIKNVERNLLVSGIRQRYGYDLAAYDPDKLLLKIKRFQNKQKLKSNGAFLTLLLRNEKKFQSLLEELFHVPEVKNKNLNPYNLVFKRRVAPYLKTYPTLKHWFIGLEKPKAIIEFKLALKKTSLLSRSHIYATDMFEKNVRALEEKKSDKHISYFLHNILTDASFQTFNTLFINTDLTGFTLSAKEKILSLFYESLVPKGFLFYPNLDLIKDTSFINQYTQLGKNPFWYQKKW